MEVSANEKPFRVLVLFDFDGTLTTRDTMLELIKFRYGPLRFWLGLMVLSPIMLLMKAGFVTAQRGKEMMLSLFFANTKEAAFTELANRFSTNVMPGIIRSKALEKFQWHREHGHEVVIVSASAGHWIRPWAMHFQTQVIATELEVVNGNITGRLKTPNCNGEEKVKRVLQNFQLSNYAVTFVYGDSKGDLPMLKLASKPFYRSF